VYFYLGATLVLCIAETAEFIEIAEKASNSAVSVAISASAIQTCPKSEMLPFGVDYLG
jgi:hypothetical protein